MKKKVVIRIICVVVIVILILVGVHFARGKQDDSTVKDSVSAQEEQQQDAEQTTGNDTSGIANENEDVSQSDTANEGNQANSGSTTESEENGFVESGDGLELPVDVLDDTENTDNGTGNNDEYSDGQIIPDTGNELPVDEIN